jgi:hypothetical protein
LRETLQDVVRHFSTSEGANPENFQTHHLELQQMYAVAQRWHSERLHQQPEIVKHLSLLEG